MLTTMLIALAGLLDGARPARSGGASPPLHHLVEIRKLEFRPARLVVAPGDTVTWINRDLVPHTASAIGAGWGSGALGRDESWQWVVPTGATGEYYCEYHPSMRGTIVVR